MAISEVGRDMKKIVTTFVNMIKTVSKRSLDLSKMSELR
jgi:hypothetical protein